MKLIEFLEKRASWLQIKGLPLILALGYGIFYFLLIIRENNYLELLLNGGSIVTEKQYWRLFTFIFVIPMHPLFFCFIVYLQWFMGTALEAAIGSFRYSLFFYCTLLISVGFAFLIPEIYITDVFHINTFLAFAILFPDFVFRLFFIIPIKVKWLAFFLWLSIGYCLIDGRMAQRVFSSPHLIERSFAEPVVASVLAVIIPIGIFFGSRIFYKLRHKTRKTIHATKQQMTTAKPRHTCKVCNITDLLDPKKEFRYLDVDGQTDCYCDSHIPVTKTSN